MHFYSNNLSAMAIISSLNILQLILACFSCKNNPIPSHFSSGSDDKNLLWLIISPCKTMKHKKQKPLNLVIQVIL